MRTPNYLIASDSMKTPKLLTKVRQSNSMVQNPVGSIVIGDRPTSNANERKVFTVSTSDRVEHTEPTDGESNNARAYATGPRVAVGGVASVEFITAADVGETRLGDEVVEESEVKVTWDREYVGDTDLNESTSKIATQCGVRGGDNGGRG